MPYHGQHDPYSQPYPQTQTQPIQHQPPAYRAPVPPPPPGSGRANGHGLPWWATALIAAGTFLAGCLGGIAVSSVDPQEEDPAAAPTPAAESPTASPSENTEDAEEAQATEAPSEPAAEPAAEPVRLTIPEDLVGRNAAIVDEELRELGFTNIQYASADANDTVVLLLANWTVIEVEPEPGSEASSDDLVILTCSKQA